MIESKKSQTYCEVRTENYESFFVKDSRIAGDFTV